MVSSLEGTRPILVELQALVSGTNYPMPKRMANGVEPNRLSLLLAVMEKRLGMHLSGQDVYVNVVGGIHIDEPAIDLGIVAAVTSSLRESPIDFTTLVMGEVGLGVRSGPSVRPRCGFGRQRRWGLSVACCLSVTWRNSIRSMGLN